MKLAIVALVVSLAARSVFAQGEIAGRVVAADSGRPALAGVEAAIPRLRLAALSDSSGRFRFRSVPAGSHLVVMRAIGFRAESSVVTVDRDEVVSWDVVLTRAEATTLPERRITAPGAAVPAKLIEFTERRKMGTGHFIDRAQLEKAEGGLRQLGDLLSVIPGVRIRRGGNKAWVASGRAVSTGCAFCVMSVAALSPADQAAGAKPACFMDVYLDGALVYDSRQPGNGLFDMNTLQPEHVAGIEVYTSTVQIPARYNRTSGGCGVILIWTR